MRWVACSNDLTRRPERTGTTDVPTTSLEGRSESDDLRFDVGDFYDHATSDRARELSLMLTDRERQKLIQIEEALKKIDEGSYGVCESCGEEIDAERLLAMPFAKLCLSCKIDLESQENL